MRSISHLKASIAEMEDILQKSPKKMSDFEKRINAFLQRKLAEARVELTVLEVAEIRLDCKAQD